VWRIESEDETISLPLLKGYNYDFQVDWGDGDLTIVNSWDDPANTHTYSSPGDYTVTVVGLLESIGFDLSIHKDKIIRVENLGDVGWKNLSFAFYGCSNLEYVAGGNTSEVISLFHMFSGTSNLASVDLSSFDTSNVEDLGFMFANSLKIKNIDLSNFVTSPDLIYTDGMFMGAINLEQIIFEGFDTSTVQYMELMFHNTPSLLYIDVVAFNTFNVTNMSQMFGDSGVLSLDLSGFNTANVLYMNGMFENSNLQALDLSSFNTSLVKEMDNMFYGTTNLNYLNITSFDLSNVNTDTTLFGENSTELVLDCGENTGEVLFGAYCN